MRDQDGIRARANGRLIARVLDATNEIHVDLDPLERDHDEVARKAAKKNHRDVAQSG